MNHTRYSATTDKGNKSKGINGWSLSRFPWHEVRPGVLLLPLTGELRGRFTPQEYVAGTHLDTWVKRDKAE